MGAMATFGRMPDGTDVHEVTIADGELTATVISYGSTVRDVRFAGVDHPLVLGFETLDDYINHSGHFGALVGRSANRIARGLLAIDGRSYQLSLNENGKHHLHGGFAGFSRRKWRVLDSDASSVALAIIGADEEEGYPGNVEVICRYRIEAPSTLRMELRASTDQATVVNLAHHSYFNLDDSSDILDHELQILAEAYTPTDEDNIPTGEFITAAGSDYDFRTPRPIRLMRNDRRVTYDINFAVDRARAAEPRLQARLRSPRSGVTLAVSSTEPGIQFYDGSHVERDAPASGLHGRRYGPSAGCCLEPQLFPDATHHTNFPSTILRPGETYRQVSLFAFSRTPPRPSLVLANQPR